MNMRPYRDEDLAKVMEIANIAWRPIRQMSREALGDTIADILNPLGDAVSKGTGTDVGHFGYLPLFQFVNIGGPAVGILVGFAVPYPL